MSLHKFPQDKPALEIKKSHHSTLAILKKFSTLVTPNRTPFKNPRVQVYMLCTRILSMANYVYILGYDLAWFCQQNILECKAATRNGLCFSRSLKNKTKFFQTIEMVKCIAILKLSRKSLLKWKSSPYMNQWLVYILNYELEKFETGEIWAIFASGGPHIAMTKTEVQRNLTFTLTFFEYSEKVISTNFLNPHLFIIWVVCG